MRMVNPFEIFAHYSSPEMLRFIVPALDTESIDQSLYPVYTRYTPAIATVPPRPVAATDTKPCSSVRDATLWVSLEFETGSPRHVVFRGLFSLVHSLAFRIAKQISSGQNPPPSNLQRTCSLQTRDLLLPTRAGCPMGDVGETMWLHQRPWRWEHGRMYCG